MKSIDGLMPVSPATDIANADPPRAGEAVSDSLWRSLRYFGVYRLVVATVFLVIYLATGGTATIASQDPRLFLWADVLYLAFGFLFLFAMARFERAFSLQLSIQVASDVLFLTLLTYASGGSRSGIAFMLVVVVAGAGLVGQGRMTLFYAALATVAILLEHSVRMLLFNADVEDFLRIGLTSVGFFATALIAQLLARRAITNERLARQRGIALAEQVRINQQVIQDMEDGVLVVSAEGRVRLHNPRAEALLGIGHLEEEDLATFSPQLAELLGSHLLNREGSEHARLTVNGRSLQVRILSSGGGADTLIYLQDIDQLQNEARQIKLAALGRLTANIAHEIRNPLAAVSHAAELLADEQRLDSRQRLVRIIVDNTARLNRLVGEVLELGRRDRAQPETIPMADFLQYFIDEYSLHVPEARQRIAVIVSRDDTICFDRSHLHRALENLLTNSLRYASGNPGAVRVRIEMPAPMRVELHIIDDGPGIPEADRSKIFEPFFTTYAGGTGLGLYIARELCEANGASLDLVESTGGAHFRIAGRGGSCPSSSSVEVATS